MPDAESPWDADPIAYLIATKFPLLQYQPEFQRNNALHAATLKAREAAAAYRTKLEALGTEEVKQLAQQERLRQVAIARADPNLASQKRPFLRPEAQADFAYWAKMSYWTNEEAVALSLGKEPAFSTLRHVTSAGSASSYTAEFRARYEIVTRAVTMGQLFGPTIPGIFLAWAERMQFPMPDELVAAVRSLGVQIADWKSAYEHQREELRAAEDRATQVERDHLDTLTERNALIERFRADQDRAFTRHKEILELKDSLIADLQGQIERAVGTQPPVADKDLSTRERESLLKLIIGMAIKGYSLDPSATRSHVTSEIAGDLHMLGISLDEDTVRKYLKEARSLLPGREVD